MTSNTDLGRLTSVDLRVGWASEARNFTPWLAEPENLRLLGDVLGLDLGVQAVEKEVGPFRADILCKEVGSDRLVLIENQIERSDHAHLGQLLTYAAGLDTAVICWIVRKFADEHRAVIDWLNTITDDRFAFFGIEIELWRIGDSPPAPRFNLVAKPNEWSRALAKDASRVRSAEATGTEANLVLYWQAFEEALEKRDGAFKPHGRPPRRGYYSYYFGNDIYLYAYRNAAKKEIGVFLAIYGSRPSLIFETLVAERQVIEREVGAQLEWRTVTPDSKYWILQVHLGPDPLDETQWAGQHQWLIERLEAFGRAFRQRCMSASAQAEVSPI